MRYKLCLILFLCLLGFQVSCQTGQASKNVSNNNNQPTVATDVSDEEIKLLFVESGLGEGDGFLEELMALPKERVVAVVQKTKADGIAKDEKGFQSESQSESLKIKSAYFLWKLGVDLEANEKYLVEATKVENHNLKFDAYGYLGVMVGKGRKEYLPMMFETVPEADGAYAMGIHGLLVDELQNSPKIFLQYLSEESSEIRKEVYKLVAYTEETDGKEIYEKVMANVEKFRNDSELKTVAEEFLREVDKERRDLQRRLREHEKSSQSSGK